MLHCSLPLRPRVNKRCEYLLTPISIAYADVGKKILCISQAKAINPEITVKYVKTLNEKVLCFDRVITDSDPALITFAKKLISKSLKPYKARKRLLACNCGAYEELVNVRMFSRRRVVNNICVFCDYELKEIEDWVLMANINWPNPLDFSFNQNWAKVDFTRFLERQIQNHKISKRNELTLVLSKTDEFGIRYQIIWAAMIVFLAKFEQDYNTTMHYVHKVQDKAFFVCSLAKIMMPKLQIRMNALPIVWLDDSPLISECRPSQIKLLRKGLITKRKELKVSLKCWR